MPAGNSNPVKKMLELFLSCLILSAVSKYTYITGWKSDLPYLVEGTERNVCYISPKGYFFLIKKKQRVKNTGRGRCV